MSMRFFRNWFVVPAAPRPRGRKSVHQVELLEPRFVLSLQGWQLFPANNPWNQNISAAPVASNSAAVIAKIGATIAIHPDWGEDNPANGASPLYGIPVNIVHGATTAKINVMIDNYPDESDNIPVPIPQNAVLEGDYQNGPNLNGGGYGENGNPNQRGDSHLIVFDEDNDIAYELYGVSRPNDPTLFPDNNDVEATKTDTAWHAAQETVWDFKTNEFRTLGYTSADAAGLSILAGLARPDEGLPTSEGGQGAINHALRLTLPSSMIDNQYIYPASHVVNDSPGTNKLPFGARLRLANTPAVNMKIAAMKPESQIVARAMQQYGLIVADIGTAMYVTGESATVDNVDSPTTNITWNMDGDILANSGLKNLKAGDFELVDLTPKVTSLSATQGAAGSQITVMGQNFSGAAGNISVFFGATQADPNSITVVSDSQITVKVPQGTGSVHVTVQSGVQETGSNSSSNVTKPIFGYGTSTATSADLFTFVTAPVANPDGYAATAGVTLTVTSPGVLANDTGGAGMTAMLATGPAHGALSLASNGSFTYTPNSGYFGADSFTYTANNGASASSPATVSITVNSGTLTWNSAANGNWTDPQWAGAGPPFPDSATNAVINTAKIVSVSSAQAAKSLSISAGQVSVGSGASLSVGGATNVTSGGVLTVNSSGTFSTGGTLTVDTGGSITGGSVHAAAFELDNGSVSANLSGPGGLTKNGSGTMTISGHDTYAGSTVVNAGQLIVDPGALPVGTSLVIGGSPGSPAIVTLAPTDANGNPLSGASTGTAGLVISPGSGSESSIAQTVVPTLFTSTPSNPPANSPQKRLAFRLLEMLTYQNGDSSLPGTVNALPANRFDNRPLLDVQGPRRPIRVNGAIPFAKPSTESAERMLWSSRDRSRKTIVSNYLDRLALIDLALSEFAAES